MAPSTIAIFPLPDVILFPGTYLPLHIFESRYRLMIEYCSESDDELAIAPLIRNQTPKDKLITDIHTVFGWGKIVQKEYLPDGRSNIVLEGKGVVELVEYQSMDPFRIATVKEYERSSVNRNQENFQEVLDEIIQLTRRIIVYEGAPEPFLKMIEDIHNYSHPIDFITSLLQYDTNQRQEILMERDEIKRAEILRNILQKINLKE
ncbi:MAG: LON peptidase substrate-binding domain-containing protein [Leptospira sp.]|nr:LON peptidase substrate-binding domain-containing protein [Leptospira sp.]